MTRSKTKDRRPRGRSSASGGRLLAFRRFVARALVAVVLFWNVLCALEFVVVPDAFAASYQLEGTGAAAAARGMGVAFLMWNATYPPVLAHPERHRTLFAVVLAQQAIGLVGETAIAATLPAGADVLAASIARFTAFDAAGLVMLAVAFALSGGAAAGRARRRQ